MKTIHYTLNSVEYHFGRLYHYGTTWKVLKNAFECYNANVLWEKYIDRVTTEELKQLEIHPLPAGLSEVN